MGLPTGNGGALRWRNCAHRALAARLTVAMRADKHKAPRRDGMSWKHNLYVLERLVIRRWPLECEHRAEVQLSPRSKIGGTPDLAAGQTYPQRTMPGGVPFVRRAPIDCKPGEQMPLTFICQVNLADVTSASGPRKPAWTEGLTYEQIVVAVETGEHHDAPILYECQGSDGQLLPETGHSSSTP